MVAVFEEPYIKTHIETTEQLSSVFQQCHWQRVEKLHCFFIYIYFKWQRVKPTLIDSLVRIFQFSSLASDCQYSQSEPLKKKLRCDPLNKGINNLNIQFNLSNLPRSLSLIPKWLSNSVQILDTRESCSSCWSSSMFSTQHSVFRRLNYSYIYKHQENVKRSLGFS